MSDAYLISQNLLNQIGDCIVTAIHEKPYHQIESLVSQLRKCKPINEEQYKQKIIDEYKKNQGCNSNELPEIGTDIPEFVKEFRDDEVN